MTETKERNLGERGLASLRTPTQRPSGERRLARGWLALLRLIGSSLASSPILLPGIVLFLALFDVGVVRADTAERAWARFTPASETSLRRILVTDLKRPKALQLLQELEQFDVLVDQFVAPFIPLVKRIAPALAQNGTQNLDDGVHLVVMRRRADFNRLFRSGHFAAFTVPTLAKTTLVVGPFAGLQSLRENLFHEYVHYRLRRDVPGGLPLWFEEGLASFLAEVSFTVQPSQSDQPSQSIGTSSTRMISYELGRWRNSEQEPDFPLHELLALRDLQGVSRLKTQRFYHSAHALVRYLFVQSKVDQQKLAASLVLGDPPFPDESLIDLLKATNALQALSGSGRRSTSVRERRIASEARAETLTGQLPDTSFVASNDDVHVEPLAAAEVREVLADASMLMNPVASERLYERVLKNEPARRSALLGYSQALRLQGKKELAVGLIARLEEIAPEDPGVLLERSSLATAGCIVQRRPECAERYSESVFDLRDVLDAQPDNFEAIYRLGLAHLYIGQAGEAQAYLEIAWRRVPWSARVNYFLGEAMRLLGDSRAQWYLENAERWAASAYFRQAARASLEALVPDTSTPGTVVGDAPESSRLD